MNVAEAVSWCLEDRTAERGGLFVNGRWVPIENESKNPSVEFFASWKTLKNAVWGSGGNAEIVLVHSHPHGGGPSKSDIEQLSQWDGWQWFANMSGGIVVDFREIEDGLVWLHYYNKEGVNNSVGHGAV